MTDNPVRWLRRLGPLCLLLAASAALAPEAAAQSGPRMWMIQGPSKCIDVPNSDYRAGVQLIVYRCQSSPNQFFVIEPDGHFVANGGNPVNGQRWCVDGDGSAVFLQPCRRLTTGDRQWWRRDGWGFIQNNRRGGPECIGLTDANAGEGSRLVIRGCFDPHTASWVPYPNTDDVRANDRTARHDAVRSGRYPNSEPNYDPERRSRWEENVAAYGPYMVVRDTRTRFCLRTHQTLSAVIASGCGNGAERFHFHHATGMIREVSFQNGYRGATGLCIEAPSSEGARLTVVRCNSSRLQQRWWLVSGQIQSRAAGYRCWDVGNESTQRNAYIIAWRCDSGRPPHQVFEISYESDFR